MGIKIQDKSYGNDLQHATLGATANQAKATCMRRGSSASSPITRENKKMSKTATTPLRACIHLFLLVISSLLLIGCAEEPQPVKNHIPAVKTQTVSPESGQSARRISAVIEAGTSTTLAFPIGGTVAKVSVELGDTVSKGQELARIDPTPFEIALRSADAQQSAARSSLLAAKEQFRRIKTLYDRGIVPGVELDNQRAALKNAESSLEVAQAQRVKAQDDLRRTSILAPFDGKISEKSVMAFQEVGAGEPVLKMIGQDGLKARALVPESLVRSLQTGSPVSVGLATLPGKRINGAVAEIGAQAEAGNAYPVLISLDRTQSTDKGILVGAAANVEFASGDGDESPVFLVPLSALATNDIPRLAAGKGTGGRAPLFVFLPEQSMVSLRLVEVRDFSGNMLTVSSGLSEGDEVVVAGASFLKDNMTVRRWEPETPREGIVMSVSGPSGESEK
jgi:RND family efflux transporter MFP subunit